MTATIRGSILLFVCLLAAGCNSIVGSDREVTLPITDLVVPESASAAAPFTVSLTVVSGGCVRFDRLIATRTPGAVFLQGRGVDRSGGNTACTTDIRTDPQVYEVTPPFSNPFAVNAVQPGGELVTRTVRIQ